MISQDRLLRIQHEQRRKAEIDAAAGLRDSYLHGVDEGKRLGLDEGKRLGIDEGRRLGLRQEILTLCQLLGLEPGPEQRALLDAEPLPALEALRQHLLSHRAWPPA